MAGFPYMQFFPADWLADCDVLSMSARGAWQTFLCKAWLARSGSITLKIPQWCRVFGATNAEQAERAIAEIEECEIGIIERHEDGRVTLTSRRITRDLEAMSSNREKRSVAARKAAAYRWDTERMRSACDAHTNSNANAMRNDAILESRSYINRERENARADSPEEIQPSRKHTPPSHRRPTLEQAKAAATNLAITSEKAEEWWHCREASDWIKAGAGGAIMPVGQNWQADLTTYARRGGYANTQPNHRDHKKEKEYPEKIKTLPRL